MRTPTRFIEIGSLVAATWLTLQTTLVRLLHRRAAAAFAVLIVAFAVSPVIDPHGINPERYDPIWLPPASQTIDPDGIDPEHDDPQWLSPDETGRPG